MSIVIDASVTLAWLYPDEITDAVRDVFDLVTNNGAVVPSLWRLEVANGLTLAVRKRRITPAFRAGALADLAFAPVVIDTETDLHAWNAALQLADRFGLTTYDAAYLELAHRRSLPLATLDTALRAAAQALGIPLMGV